ncbi:EcsC family protein [Patiriisocius sp. Uisw_047]|uniref:EcsC family protein n=1 Tax=Patiriisocius sp. Uisw_047 TaxID=3230969 RepID=UPI0039E746C2
MGLQRWARCRSKVSERVAAHLIPGLGSLTGSAINYILISHFQKMTEAHFTIRWLERNYGMEAV